MSDTAAELRSITQKVIDSEQIEVVTPNTKVNPTSNTDAVIVRVTNNTPVLVMVGMQAAQVDALSTPVKGYPLNRYDSRAFAVVNNANEVVIDAALANTKVSIEIYGRD